MHAEDDELGRILDEGIARYGDAELGEVLAERIIGRVRTDVRRWWAMRMGAGLAAAGVMMILLVRSEKTEQRPRAAAMTVIVPPVAVSTEVMPVSWPAKVHPRRQSGLTKKAVFPTPAPMTAEERGLMALLKHEGSLPALESLRDADKEVEIRPLVIAPIDKAEEEK